MKYFRKILRICAFTLGLAILFTVAVRKMKAGSHYRFAEFVVFIQQIALFLIQYRIFHSLLTS